MKTECSAGGGSQSSVLGFLDDFADAHEVLPLHLLAAITSSFSGSRVLAGTRSGGSLQNWVDLT